LALRTGIWARLWHIFGIFVSFLLEEDTKRLLLCPKLLHRNNFFIAEYHTANTPLHFSAAFKIWATFSYIIHGITDLIHEICQKACGYISFHIIISCTAFIILNSDLLVPSILHFPTKSVQNKEPYKESALLGLVLNGHGCTPPWSSLSSQAQLESKFLVF
jgi:uncharacterized membrane protein YkgB